MGFVRHGLVRISLEGFNAMGFVRDGLVEISPVSTALLGPSPHMLSSRGTVSEDACLDRCSERERKANYLPLEYELIESGVEV